MTMMTKGCTVEECDRGGRLRRGWCDVHYQRWYTHGTTDLLPPRPERWMCECPPGVAVYSDDIGECQVCFRPDPERIRAAGRRA